MSSRALDRSKRVGVLARALIMLVRAYQWTLSPILGALGAQCRFHPSCSAYALAVIEKDGPVKGTMRAIGRLLRCHPLHPGGFDPP